MAFPERNSQIFHNLNSQCDFGHPDQGLRLSWPDDLLRLDTGREGRVRLLEYMVDKDTHFISGLPCSGATLMSAIPWQNPSFMRGRMIAPQCLPLQVGTDGP